MSEMIRTALALLFIRLAKKATVNGFSYDHLKEAEILEKIPRWNRSHLRS